MKVIPCLLVILLTLWTIVSCTAPVSPTPDAFQPVLEIFPLVKGATWTYTDTEYDPSRKEPAQIIQAVYEVTQQVTEVKKEAGVYLAQVQQTVKKLSADESWSQDLHLPPKEYTFWYLIRENRVYSVNDLPANLEANDDSTLILEFQFPMAQDSQWCPNSRGKEIAPDFTGPTPYPCQYAGMRIIQKAGPQQIQGKRFEQCYQMVDKFNSGGTVQTFCDGIGVIARKYDHGGSRFGFSWELREFRK